MVYFEYLLSDMSFTDIFSNFVVCLFILCASFLLKLKMWNFILTSTEYCIFTYFRVQSKWDIGHLFKIILYILKLQTHMSYRAWRLISRWQLNLSNISSAIIWIFTSTCPLPKRWHQNYRIWLKHKRNIEMKISIWINTISTK